MSTRGSCKTHEEKSFSNVFYRFQPYERMRKHAFTGQNTQHKSKRKKTIGEKIKETTSISSHGGFV